MLGKPVGGRGSPESSAEVAAHSPAASIDTHTARTALIELRRSLRSASGQTRTGLLRLRRDHDANALPRFEHQSSFHLKRVSRAQVQDTAQALRELFTAAGLPARAVAELEHYLRANGERAQAGRIVELLDQHLQPTAASMPQRPVPDTPPPEDSR